MGKKQHQKDKLYLTTKEWKEEWGGKKDEGQIEKFRRLPFNYCSISLQPFEHPLCTVEGVVFDLLNILPFLKVFKKSPVTGEPMSAKDLIKLTFHKNSKGEYHCPVMYKVFNENSTIVAIKTTGNVFSMEAVEELNLKTKNFKDLLTSEPFTRKDIITIQDPAKLEKFNISNFYHIKHNMKVIDDDEEVSKKDPMYRIRKANLETESTLKELEETYKEPKETYLKSNKQEENLKKPKYLAHYSTGAMSASFTSTSQDRSNTQQAAALHEDVVRYELVKKLGKKGYVRMTTNLGNINLELHCEMVQKTCENFITHCNNGYYSNTIFHRLIKHFMVQGGDPTGTGKGGESIWGKPFKDEFKPNLTHSGRGVLSMANSGKNTNGSQFFITFRSCQHLDNKHTIFGRVVGGLDILNKIESIKCNEEDRPLEEIKVVNMTVFVNPFQEVDDQLKQEEENQLKKAQEEVELQKIRKVSRDVDNKPKVYRSSGIAKYIPTDISKRYAEDDEGSIAPKSKKKINSSDFTDFSSW
ncbi:RING-type E3 ubiquitin-protein ligase PPIL2 isoform X1 [Hydra vulgaris]|uniref:RING-type E3 ubiquitin-protein ligase PPIL2 isoform X1 n=1 Tax=Hydra vulgaris TaxID=6087 RepID=UPI001F5FE6D4|nr:RING-type E3 ubiquitin-protein ligase PPIL2 [Hydra vulgaris]